jgi:ubiquinone/menaquinone biosynthesis C-methylase UbiE
MDRGEAPPVMTGDPSYVERLEAESRKWGEHLQVEASGQMLAWLDHPLVNEHYRERAQIDGRDWRDWVPVQFAEPARHSLDLGCGAGANSLELWRRGSSLWLDGFDVSSERVAEGERRRVEIGAPGRLWVDDVNTIELPARRYDLVFSCHSFHHFLALERVLAQVARALTPRGLFVLEEFVGPTQFQWTDLQMDLASALIRMLPERLRVLPWGAVKHGEGRPTPEQVGAVSPFESIRSGEIVGLFERYFDVLLVRKLGGTIQQLLYNGIAHCFSPLDAEAETAMRAIFEIEDRLVDSGALPSDFMLLVGRAR